jgi:hypothetical protein
MLPCLLQITYKPKKEGRSKKVNTDAYTNNMSHSTNDSSNSTTVTTVNNEPFKFIKNNKFIEGILLGYN